MTTTLDNLERLLKEDPTDKETVETLIKFTRQLLANREQILVNLEALCDAVPSGNPQKALVISVHHMRRLLQEAIR